MLLDDVLDLAWAAGIDLVQGAAFLHLFKLPPG
jgi:hypothetical protein